MIAAVFGVIAASTRPGSIVHVPGVTSTNTGRAPAAMGAYAVAENVNAGRMTSSPQPMPRAFSATSMVTVPLDMSTPCLAPWYAANRSSNSAALGPGSGKPPHRPLRTTSVTAATSSSSPFGHSGYGSERTGGPPLIASSAIAPTFLVVPMPPWTGSLTPVAGRA
jgi:hypothetical protein